MAKLSLPLRGKSIDLSSLTALKRFVRKGKKFYGAGSDEIQTGEMPEVSAIAYNLPINGTYKIPEGYHDGNGIVNQNIATLAGKSITPGAGKDVVQCNGKYMTGNITVLPVTNLRADLIKFGVVVGEGEGAVTGTWQGFID